jgi:hypothetical protein
MKKLFLSLMLLINLQVWAQTTIISGGFGHFMTGPSYSYNSSMENFLKGNTMLGSSLNLNRVGILSGGQGFAVIGERYLIGGGGWGSSTPSTTTNFGKVSQTNSGGMFNMGYMLRNSRKSFCYAFAGFGGGSVNYEISNYSSSPMYFDEFNPIQPGEKRKYNMSGTSYELGFSFKQFVTNGSCKMTSKSGECSIGGLMIGLDAGLQYTIATAGWDKVSHGAPEFNPYTIYFRLTLGGGFTYKSADIQ